MLTLDERLFLLLNFDGGPSFDRFMLTVSGTIVWLPLYLLIFYLVFRRMGWRNLGLFLVLLLVVLGLSDILSGVFKANGLLGDLLPSFQPRWRPMFTPALEGLSISPDSLYTLRKMGVAGDWNVHVPMEAISGRYGTVSAHAATIVALAVLSCGVIRKRWFILLMVCCTLLICYSRIYLAKHFPMDLLWGALLGALLGVCAMWIIHRTCRTNQ